MKKVPLLLGKTIVNLFFEASTRTRTTFELAAKRLSADVLNINITQSSTVKGETLLDTLRNLEAMHVDMFVVRHADSGWDHYANRWELLAPDGEVLATRMLAHPHVHEQPFTRGLTAVRIPGEFTWVRVRAHDLVHGYGGREVTLSVPK